jgi:hypothetical protein
MTLRSLKRRQCGVDEDDTMTSVVPAGDIVTTA